MNRPRRKSVNVVSYKENGNTPDSERRSRRSMRKTIGSELKVQEQTTRKSTVKESSESEEDSPIEISDDEIPTKSRKSKSRTDINNIEDTPKKQKLTPRNRTPSLRALESITTESSPTVNAIESSSVRKSSRFRTPSSVRMFI